MKYPLIAVLIAILLYTSAASFQEIPQMVFCDEFEGNALNQDLWKVCPREERHGGSFWVKENVWLDGEGHLVLAATPSPVKGYANCGAIRSRGKFSHSFGYYEASIAFPQLRGCWGAFWLYDSCVLSRADEGRDGTEIDIFESINSTAFIGNSALHWDGYGPEHQSASKVYSNLDIYDGTFHTFALDWREDEYIFYIDDTEVWRTQAGGVCQVPLYLKLTLEASPEIGKLDTESMPKYMLVDYVKVWNKKP